MPRKSLNLPNERKFKGPAIIWKRFIAFIIDLLIIDFAFAYPFRRVITRIMPAGGFSETYAALANNLSLTKESYGEDVHYCVERIDHYLQRLQKDKNR